ncbi:histidine phosphatase family protein [Streptomyces sp. MUM 178J]|uniref:histidine phosphatase family protein n=1 Tax=Streptomyces sp. MUM 178J TaxID=2791991 RepID=UPI001F041D07|nr:histidine phosphatase family protein [Streptomyces sp. MUM 178J]WRQ80739.1 histidine phosphatase family protein [Streptomyces sp. MUM 178J]
MTTRLTLISPATSRALRSVRFDDDSPLDPAGIARAEAAAGAPPPASLAFTSPSRRCRDTARALGMTDAEPQQALAPCDMGRWRGRSLDEVAAAEAEAVALWLNEPTAAPHGGEALRAVRLRVGSWLDNLRAGPSARVVAVVEPDVVRAAVVHALDSPDHALWRVDVRPLTATELSGRAERWNVLAGRSLEPHSRS